jgi:hypothetical protein
MVNGWTPERRAKQAELIRQWMPWKQSTGPKSVEGKERVAKNAWTGGHRQKMRELTKMVNEQVKQSRALVKSCQ